MTVLCFSNGSTEETQRQTFNIYKTNWTTAAWKELEQTSQNTECQTKKIKSDPTNFEKS